MSKNIINKLNATLGNSNAIFNSNNSNNVNSADSTTVTNVRNFDMAIAKFTVPVMDKDAMLEAEYDKAMEKWKKSLAVLTSVAQRELALADKYAEDIHMPYDAIARLKNQIARTEEKMKALSDAHCKLMTYRFNR